ncbi:HET-domain-containing protein [Xylariaceae sp. AK1471]|nr:HET-domain-containing protein [Xylariaceae sp. AK1471]
MWLLNVSDLRLHKFMKYPVPSYAILSHTWLDEAEEVSFHDMRKDLETAKHKRGFSKIQLCCSQAKADGYEYTWVDTCCIDKSSSAELSEAINSMYKWYQNAKVCYAYLADVPSGGFVPDIDDQTDMFSKSRWFRRGWTLLELIAPAKVIFFTLDWSPIGTKKSIDIRQPDEPTRVLVSKLARITGIETRVLYDPVEIETTFVAQRMSWASRRNTAREEDLAYCLMGLFNINMPILYGEGLHKAFKRLQLELISSSTDQTIFAWRGPRGTSGLLADKPLDFVDSGDIYAMIGQGSLPLPYSMTNSGLSINLPLQPMQGHGNENNFIAFLQCCRCTNIPGTYETVCIYMEQLHIQDDSKAIYRRIKCNEFRFEPFTESHSGNGSDVYVYDNDPVLRHWLRPNTVIGQDEYVAWFPFG